MVEWQDFFTTLLSIRTKKLIGLLVFTVVLTVVMIIGGNSVHLLRGDLLGQSEMRQRVMAVVDTSHDDRVSAREMRAGLASTMRGVRIHDLTYDVDGDGVTDRNDLRVSVKVLRSIFLCGNGRLDSGEQCDDGNASDGDGCSAACMATETVAIVDAKAVLGGTEESPTITVSGHVSQFVASAHKITVNLGHAIPNDYPVPGSDGAFSTTFAVPFGKAYTPVITVARPVLWQFPATRAQKVLPPITTVTPVAYRYAFEDRTNIVNVALKPTPTSLRFAVQFTVNGILTPFPSKLTSEIREPGQLSKTMTMLDGGGRISNDIRYSHYAVLAENLMPATLYEYRFVAPDGSRPGTALAQTDWKQISTPEDCGGSACSVTFTNPWVELTDTTAHLRITASHLPLSSSLTLKTRGIWPNNARTFSDIPMTEVESGPKRTFEATLTDLAPGASYGITFTIPLVHQNPELYIRTKVSPLSSNEYRCGDRYIDTTRNEQCDDGNMTALDGCDQSCKIEVGWRCENGYDCRPICGDRRVTQTLATPNELPYIREWYPEQCDDGNATNGDGCSQTCQPEPGWQCLVSGCRPLVGDGLLTGSETCDDGNAKSGDGCSDSGLLETGAECPILGTSCIPSRCGDGRVREGETCDDGDQFDGDGCNRLCAIENGWFCENSNGGQSTCSVKPWTPNSPIGCIEFGKKGRYEFIDNDPSQLRQIGQCCDGLTPLRTEDLAFECRRVGNGICEAEDGETSMTSGGDCSCGNGIIDAARGEECDMGFQRNGQGKGCSATCTADPGWTCYDQNRLCYNTCGNRQVDAVPYVGSEQCDDGNILSNDGCSSSCQAERGGWTRDGLSFRKMECGNGMLEFSVFMDESEQCDDGNTTGGDGCSIRCTVEANWQCRNAPLSSCTRIR